MFSGSLLSINWTITISFLSIFGCNNQNSTKEQSSISKKRLKEDYELQERCGKQCKKWFINENGEPGLIINNKDGSYFKNYNNHYKKK